MIKKIILISFFPLFFTYSSSAQSFKGGLHIGLLATQVDGDFRGSYNKPGLFVGAFALLPFYNETMGIQLELNYAQKGSKSQGRLSDGTLNKSRLALHQIEVPVLYRWEFVNNLSIMGGLSFNMIVDNKVYDISGSVMPDWANVYEIKFFELGLLLGLNYIVQDHYGFSFRYGYSLTPIGPSLDPHPIPARRGLRNNFLQFHFSYQF